MPLRNQLFGVFKLAQILNDGGTYDTMLIQNATQSKTMEAAAKSFIQGTAETRILDIGMLSETISITAPIIVGGASVIDGRTLLGNMITRAANPDSITLPILESATVKISATEGGTIEMKLKSDGNTIAPSFQIINVADAPGGAPPDAMDPTKPGGPSRMARNYDFKVKFGPYVTFVQDANIEVSVDVGQGVQFLIPYNGADQRANPEMGTQMPYLGVKSIKITGTGTAAVDVKSTNDPQIAGQEQGVTRQDNYPTYPRPDPSVIATTDTFNFMIGTEDLFPGVDVSNSVINSTDFNISDDILTVKFGFTSWVKIYSY